MKNLIKFFCAINNLIVLEITLNEKDIIQKIKKYSDKDGLDLKVNVKSQLIGDGSFAKYFYVNYKNEEFILDIDNLELKELTNKIDLKYHMLPNKDYEGINFKFDKMKSTLIVKSTDGIMDLVFNSETRGLLIKSRLNFTQENSTGIMMSSYIEESKIDQLDQTLQILVTISKLGLFRPFRMCEILDL